MTITRMHLRGVLLTADGFQVSPLSRHLTVYRTDEGFMPDDGNGQPDQFCEPLETRRNGEVWEIGNGSWWFQLDSTDTTRLGLS